MLKLMSFVLWMLVVFNGVLFAGGEPIFREDFDDANLGDKWIWKPSPEGETSYKVEGGCLVLTNTNGAGQWGENPFAPKFMRKVGTEDVEITIKLVDYKPVEAWEEAGLILYQDEDNWFKFQVANNGKFVQLDCAGLIDGRTKGFRSPKYEQDSIYFRVKRKSGIYYFLYSSDGEKFVCLGLMRAEAYTDPQVGFFGSRWPEHTKPNIAKFDFFEVRNIE